jgi:hypothetical protein
MCHYTVTLTHGFEKTSQREMLPTREKVCEADAASSVYQLRAVRTCLLLGTIHERVNSDANKGEP